MPNDTQFNAYAQRMPAKDSEYPVLIESHDGINVLRDDVLPGGTKSILLKEILPPAYEEYIYASPVYGAFQVALTLFCQNAGKTAVIFCAKRKTEHQNTRLCREAGAKVIELPAGYLSVLEHHARKYEAENKKAYKIHFGAYYPESLKLIADRTKQVIRELGDEPDVIFCAIGSGTLVQGILLGTSKCIVHGVAVGKEYADTHERLVVHRYHLPFEKVSRSKCSFPSTPNYDLKAWEYCLRYSPRDKKILFWNVL